MAKDSPKGPPVSFQFYPGDWRRDPAVTSMERHDRSVWIDLVCIMHDSPERGVLLLPNGRPMTDLEISRNLGLTLGQARKSIQSILESGTGSRRDDGALFNRRMVRDEAIRKVRTECGSLGGNPNLVKQNSTNMDNQSSNQKPTPSSSSSSSSSREGNINLPKPKHSRSVDRGSPPGFAEFWREYPKKKSKGAALKAWRGHQLELRAAEIVKAVKTQRDWPEWNRDSGKYIPHPASWLNAQGWDDEFWQPNSNGNGHYPGKIERPAAVDPAHHHHCPYCESPHDWNCKDPEICNMQTEIACPEFAARFTHQ